MGHFHLSSQPVRVLALAALTVMTGCGGGGGNAGTEGTTGALAITDANANGAARAALSGANGGQVAGGFGALISSPTAQQAVVNETRRARAMAAQMLGAQRFAQAKLVVLPCSQGGAGTVSLNDLNGNNLLDLGESLTLTALACKDSGTTLDGSLTLTLMTYTNADNFAFTLGFSGFTVTDSAQSASVYLDGGLAASVANGTSFNVNSPSFSVGAVSLGVRHTFTAQAYAVSFIDSGSQISETVAGSFSSSDFGGGSVKVSTPVAIVVLAADSTPSQGTLRVEGAGGSALQVKALNSAQAELSIDANGDGSFETVRVVSWSELG